VTPTATQAFVLELTKTASPGLGTLLGQRVTKTVKLKAKKAMGKKASATMDSIKSLLSKGKKLVAEHPGKSMMLGGASIGAATSGKGHRMEGALKGGALGGALGALGHIGTGAYAVGRDPELIKMYERAAGNPAKLKQLSDLIVARHKGAMIATGAGGAALGGWLGGRSASEKTAGRSIVNGTGRGMPKKLPGKALVNGTGRGIPKRAGMDEMEQSAMGTGSGVRKIVGGVKRALVGGRRGLTTAERAAGRRAAVVKLRELGYPNGKGPTAAAARTAWSAANRMPGKGGKAGALKKTAEEEAGENVQDVLAQMLAQSQGGDDQTADPMFQDYQPQEPMWADQGATDQMAVEDPVYGHGKGLKNMRGKAAPKMTVGFNPKTAPGAFKAGGGKRSIAKKAAAHFFGKTADYFKQDNTALRPFKQDGAELTAARSALTGSDPQPGAKYNEKSVWDARRGQDAREHNAFVSKVEGRRIGLGGDPNDPGRSVGYDGKPVKPMALPMPRTPKLGTGRGLAKKAALRFLGKLAGDPIAANATVVGQQQGTIPRPPRPTTYTNPNAVRTGQQPGVTVNPTATASNPAARMVGGGPTRVAPNPKTKPQPLQGAVDNLDGSDATPAAPKPTKPPRTR